VGSRGLLQTQVSPNFIWVLATLASILIGNWLQSGVHLNHDVSWIAHSARWLLQGGSFFSDVLDPNPPMAWFLSMPAAALTNFGLLAEPAAIRLIFWTYFVVSAALLFHVLSHVEPREHAASIGWKAGFVVMATLAPAASFGQREYVSVLFAMPYLAAAVLRLQGLRGPGQALCVAIGLLAGVGFAIKPYFLAVPLLVEGLLVARLGLRSLFRIESLALGLTVLCYVLTVVVLVPQYLELTVPLMRSVYWAYDTPNFAVVLARFRDVIQPLLYGALIALLARCWTRQHTVMLLAGAGYAVSYFVQAKGFVYHAFPVLLCACVFLGICLGSGLSHVWRKRRTAPSPVQPLLVAGMLLLTVPPIKQAHDAVARWYFQYNIAWGEVGQYREAIIATVNQYAPSRQSYFFAFSTHPYPGFPTASYTDADFSGRSAAQGIIPAYARMDELTDPTLKAKVVQAASLQRRMVIEDFERRPPSIVFAERSLGRLGMNGRPFDDLAFYLEDPGFRQIWSSYEEYPPIGPLRVFVRRGADQTER
jgi:hypothetical protein